jgi:hypothetical protein
MEENINCLIYETLFKRYVKLLTAYNAVKKLYKAWKREIRPQLVNCIAFEENKENNLVPKFTVTCPKEKIKQIASELEKKIRETSAVFLDHETTLIEDLIDAIEEIQYPLVDFEELLKTGLHRAEHLLYNIETDKYFDALDTILTCGDQPGAEC